MAPAKHAQSIELCAVNSDIIFNNNGLVYCGHETLHTHSEFFFVLIFIQDQAGIHFELHFRLSEQYWTCPPIPSHNYFITHHKLSGILRTLFFNHPYLMTPLIFQMTNITSSTCIPAFRSRSQSLFKRSFATQVCRTPFAT